MQEEKMREQNKRKAKSQSKLLVERGPEHVRLDHNIRQKLSRKRKLIENPKSLHINEQKRKTNIKDKAEGRGTSQTERRRK